ncbi:MAG: glycosyltransferase family 39 protein [Solirubrobacteraceae bacterium]
MRFRDGAVVAAPSALAAALCLYEITGRSLGLDETASATIAAQHGGALGTAIARDGGNMAGYYALLHVLIDVFGNGALVLRVPSALASTATVAIVGLLGLRLFDRRIGLAAGVLSAVSLPLVFWGQSARGYAPMVALVAGSFLAFASLIDPDRDARNNRRAWLGFVLATTLAAYCGFVAVLVIGAQLLTLFYFRDRRALGPVGSALAVIAACCAPLVVLAVKRGSGQLFWVPRPSVNGGKQVLEALTSSGLQPSFHPTSTSLVLLGLTLALLTIVAGTIVRRFANGRRDRAAWGPALVLSWLVVPVVLALAESWPGQPIFLPRNLLVALPAVALLLAWGIADRRVPRLIAWSSLVALVALRALQLAPSYHVSPENWRAASAYVLARSRAGDCLAFYPSDGRMAFRYYLGRSAASAFAASGSVSPLSSPPSLIARAPRPVLPAAPWREVHPYVEDYASLSGSELARLPSGCPRLWLIASHRGQPQGSPVSRANYARYVALRAALAGEYARPGTVAFGYASPVAVDLFAK